MSADFESILKKYIDLLEPILPKGELKEVRHYFDHGEYEMALEGLLIELIHAKKHPKNFNYVEWEEMTKNYNLDKESIFDDDIWDKFVKWGQNYKANY